MHFTPGCLHYSKGLFLIYPSLEGSGSGCNHALGLGAEGFWKQSDFSGANKIVHAVTTASDQDGELLTPIDKLLKGRITPAYRLIEILNDERSIDKTLQRTYTEFTG